MTNPDPRVVTELVTYIATPCPDYCDLPPMHPIDNQPLDGKGGFRIHNGPKFGRFLDGWAEEYAAAPGTLITGVDVVTGNDSVEVTADELDQLADDARKAAEWLRAQK
ncbi:hypothetical protein [Nocardioides marmoraquaticus]